MLYFCFLVESLLLFSSVQLVVIVEHRLLEGQCFSVCPGQIDLALAW